ncbi:hypothetical protein GCM10027416_07520 [Okibacterium endophyticum]
MNTERDINDEVAQPRDDERNLSSLGDPAHPFDQTNGIVEGLEGNADDPENQDDGSL